MYDFIGFFLEANTKVYVYFLNFDVLFGKEKD